MALRTVTPVINAPNVLSNDLVAGADLCTTITSTDTWQIVTPTASSANAALDTSGLLIVISYAGAAVIVVTQGTYPPSLRQGLGNLTFGAGTSGQVKWFMLEAGRFIQNNSGVMTIQGTNSGGSCQMAAYILPTRGLGTTSKIEGLTG